MVIITESIKEVSYYEGSMPVLEKVINWLQRTIDRTVVMVAQAQSGSASSSPQQEVGLRTIIRDHLREAFFWAAVAITTIVLILLISITRVFEEWLDPLLFRIKRFAPYIMQIAFGVGLVLSAFYSGFLGPTLPLADIFGGYTNVVRWMFYIGGIMLLTGIYPRLVSFAVLLVTIPLAFQHTTHFLQHAVYIGEAGTVFLFGGAYNAFAASAKRISGMTKEIRLHLHKYKFIILRIFLGISILASAVYSQQLQPDSLPASVTESQLVAYFPDLSFFLLAVMIIEILLGLFIMIGFEIRFASLAYLAFLIFSVVFFEQAAWPHVILVGTPLAMLTHGYDKYTVGGWLFSRGNLEPIL